MKSCLFWDKVAQPPAPELVLSVPRCNKFVSILFKFLVFFYTLKYICHQNTPKLYLLFLLWAYHRKPCRTNASKMCQFFRFGLHPYKLATPRATIGLILISCCSIKRMKINGFVTSQYLNVTSQKTFVARNKFPHVKVVRNTEKVGQACVTTSGRPEPEYTLRRVISSEPIHDEQLTKNCKQMADN